jgi:hypothetical protein
MSYEIRVYVQATTIRYHRASTLHAMSLYRCLKAKGNNVQVFKGVPSTHYNSDVFVPYT